MEKPTIYDNLGHADNILESNSKKQKKDKYDKKYAELRKLVPVGRSSNHGWRDLSTTFSVLTYNILCQQYIKKNFIYADKTVLSQPYRKKNHLSELASYNCDIMLLQEVDKNVYEGQYKSVFQQLGYTCHYKKRVSNKPDGVSICFKTDKFKLIEEKPVEFHRPDIVDESIGKIAPQSTSTLEPNRYHKGNVGLILVLSYGNKNGLIVGCNHIYYKAEDDYLSYVQHIQVDSFLRQLTYFKKKYPSYSVIYGGDFNTIPSTTVYNYILSESQKLGFPLRSSYSHYNPSDARRNGEPDFTNFTGNFVDTLDYIFYEERNVSPTELRTIMDEKECSAETALPNSVWSSDHICLQANFVFNK